MYRRVPQRAALQIAIALTLCAALLPVPSIASLIAEAAQGQNDNRKGRPRPGKPEGLLPNLDQIRDESQLEREAPPPIPSTIRAKKNEGKPWDGSASAIPSAGQIQPCWLATKRAVLTHAGG